MGFVKLNTDVAFQIDERNGAVGAILQDMNENFIATSSELLSHVALPMRHGLLLASHIGCNSVKVDSDNIEVIDACIGRDQMVG